MSHTFHVPETVVNQVVAKLKSSHLVHSEASFNHSAQDGLRKEIAYRDLDFLDRLGRTEFEESTVDEAVLFLKSMDLVDQDADYDVESFDLLREHLNQRFTRKSWSTVSPVMERTFFMLTNLRKPMTLLELGCFWGNTLAWFAGPTIGPKPVYTPERVIGIDVDTNAMDMAKENFANIENASHVRLITEDARETLKDLQGPFDFVYIEAKSQDGNLYLPLLKQVYDRLPRGAWVMAHDSTRYTFRNELRAYMEFVRNKSHFSESISFDIDAFGGRALYQMTISLINPMVRELR